MTLTPKRTWFLAAVMFACLAGILSAMAGLSLGPKAPVWRFVVLAVAAHAPYAGLLLLAGRLKVPATVSIGAAALLRLVLVVGQPVFSDDVYRYVWDGRIVAAGGDPYAHPPSSPALAALRDGVYEGINNKELRTIYPPLAELAFGAVAALTPSVRGFQAASAIADLAAVALIVLLARLWSDKERGARPSPVAGLAYGLNPLVCVESAMSAHLEPLAIAMVVAAMVLLALERGGRIRTALLRGAAASALAAGVCVKLFPLAFLPPLGRRLRALSLAVPIALVAAYALFWSPGLGPVRTLDTFARRWEGNASVFALLETATRSAIGLASAAETPDAMIHVAALDAPARSLQGTFFSLHKDGGFDPQRPGAFALSDLSRAIAKIICFLGFVGVIAWTSSRRLDPISALLWIGGAFVLLTPVMHPWYALWVLPWAAYRGAVPWLAFAAVLPLAYLPLDGWWASGEWCAPLWIQLVEYSVLGASAAVWLVVGRGRRAGARTQLT